MAKPITVAGTTIGISLNTSPATFDVAGYSALTYLTIADVLECGSYGRSYALVKLNTLGNRKTQKARGSFDNGSLAIKLAKSTLVNTDAGQAAANSANNSDSTHSFMVTNQDGSKDYFTGVVLSFMTTIGTVDTWLMGELKVELNNDVISVIS